ncbi:MAG: hypothetical protein WKG07_16090 [Hymenobacter sp.]
MANKQTEQDVNALLGRAFSPVLKAEIGKVIVGQSAVLDEVLVVLLAGGHALLEGVPGPGCNPAGAAGRGHRFAVSPHPVHLIDAHFDILGTEVLEEDHGTGHRSFKFNLGPFSCQPGAGRRNQPHTAQNPGRPAGGHAGLATQPTPAWSTRWLPASSCWPPKPD